MKPIEPGTLVLTWRVASHAQSALGAVWRVANFSDGWWPCTFCRSTRRAEADSDFAGGYRFSCPCSLIRIDDDPDAETRDAERERPVGAEG